VPVCSLPTIPDQAPFSPSASRLPSDDLDEIADWSEDNYRSWWESLSDDEKIAVNVYKSGNYGEINSYLRGLANYDKTIYVPAINESIPIENLVANLDTAMKKAVIPEDMVVRRYVDRYAFEDMLGTSADQYAYWFEDPSDRFIGTVFADDAFTSTSMSSEFVWGGGQGVELEIYVRAGMHGFVEDPSLFIHGNGISREAEMLLDRGIRFRIISMEVEKGAGAYTIKKMILEAIP